MMDYRPYPAVGGELTATAGGGVGKMERRSTRRGGSPSKATTMTTTRAASGRSCSAPVLQGALPKSISSHCPNALDSRTTAATGGTMMSRRCQDNGPGLTQSVGNVAIPDMMRGREANGERIHASELCEKSRTTATTTAGAASFDGVEASSQDTRNTSGARHAHSLPSPLHCPASTRHAYPAPCPPSTPIGTPTTTLPAPSPAPSPLDPVLPYQAIHYDATLSLVPSRTTTPAIQAYDSLLKNMVTHIGFFQRDLKPSSSPSLSLPCARGADGGGGGSGQELPVSPVDVTYGILSSQLSRTLTQLASLRSRMLVEGPPKACLAPHPP